MTIDISEIIALVLVMVKCYDIKMAFLPFNFNIIYVSKPEATNQQQHKKTMTRIFLQVFGRNDDGFSISVRSMYLVQWTVFFCFHSAHWEKYNTGVREHS